MFNVNTIGTGSTNETYDSTAKSYGNPGTQTITLGASDWTAPAGGFSFGAGTVADSTNDRHAFTSAALSGDFSFSYIVNGSAWTGQ